MSHFTVLVFAEPHNVDDIMEKYDENLSVEEYTLGLVSENDKQSFVDSYIEQYVNNKNISFDILYEKHGEDWNRNAWKKTYNDEWEKFSTYNPDSKWDWYQMGGRWDNAIPYNTCLSSEIGRFVPFAYVDENGNWHEAGSMGWFATASNKKDEDEWNTEFHRAIENYKGIVTLLDCHI